MLIFHIVALNIMIFDCVYIQIGISRFTKETKKKWTPELKIKNTNKFNYFHLLVVHSNGWVRMVWIRKCRTLRHTISVTCDAAFMSHGKKTQPTTRRTD